MNKLFPYPSGPFPPGTLQWSVAVPTGLMDELLSHGFFTENSKVLDVGCGGGNWMNAIYLLFRNIEYIGLDVEDIRLKICEHAIKSRRYQNFEVKKLDVYSELHNKTGSIDAADAKFPVDDNWADFVICHSLFTHLSTKEAASNYISEIKRCMTPHGKLWITFYSSPPNELSSTFERTVYPKEFIDDLLKDFKLIYRLGGKTTEMNDHTMMCMERK